MGKALNAVFLLVMALIISAIAGVYAFALQQAQDHQFQQIALVADILSADGKDQNLQWLEDQNARYQANGLNILLSGYDKDDLIYVWKSEAVINEQTLLTLVNSLKTPVFSAPPQEWLYYSTALEQQTLILARNWSQDKHAFLQQSLPILVAFSVSSLILLAILYYLIRFRPQTFGLTDKERGLSLRHTTGLFLKLTPAFNIQERNDLFSHEFGNDKKSFNLLVKPTEREKVEQYLSQVLNTATLVDFECTLINGDGEESRWALRAKPLRQMDQLLLVVTGDDISKRYHMEVELRHERNCMQTYLNTMHTLLIITDRSGTIKVINHQLATLLNMQERAIIGKNIALIVPKSSQLKINEYIRTTTPLQSNTTQTQFPLVAQSGKEFSIDWRIAALPVVEDEEDEEDEVLLTGLDITESMANNEALKAANIQIREALRSAEQANQSKSIFLANMSHEIRTPMNGILGATELLLDQTINDEQHQFVDIIHSSSQALLNIINDILDLSKIESGNFELENINFDLHQLCHDVYQLFSNSARQKGLQVIFYYSDNLPQTWQGDPTRIRQILNNLMSNALKFTHEGRIDLRVYGELNPHSHQYDVKIQIKDTGIGIPEKKVEQIFSAFQQADTSTSRKYGGTGLGLTISQHLAQAMEGEIVVNSDIGVGSTFTLKTSLLPAEMQVQKKRKTSGRNYQARVLLAEDNAVNSKIACKILAKLGVDVHAVEDGEAALNEVLNNHYDLVLMDVNMPIMDGILATEKIRELSFPKNQVPILALTANAMMEDKKRCIDAGMNGFISKPIKVEKLIEELDVILSSESAS